MEHSYPADTSDETSGGISAEFHEKAIAKITRVLKFLQEFDLAKTPPIVSLGEQPWKQYFDGLPNSSMIQVGAHYKYLKQIFDSQNLADGNFILKSGRPTETPCPPPRW